MQESCIDRFDAIDCRAAVNFCDSTMGAAFQASGKFTQRDCQIETSKSDTLCNFRRTQLLRHLQGSPTYTYSHKPRLSALQPCLGDLCYLEAAKIKDYLNTPETRTLLGVESPNNFTSCSSDVGRAFNSHLDKYAVPAHFHVAALLERGVRVLAYNGDYDFVVNWPGTQRCWYPFHGGLAVCLTCSQGPLTSTGAAQMRIGQRSCRTGKWTANLRANGAEPAD